MGFNKILVNQVRKPRGRLGRLIANGMNKGHAELAKWGFSQFFVKPNYIILDVGCGGGGNVNQFAKIAVEGKVYGIDYSKTSVSVSKKVNQEYIDKGIVEIHQSSVSSLPFEDNYFDLITGFEAYYFWSDLINDLRELFRILKRNGKLILVNEGYICSNDKKRKQAEKWSKLGNFTIHTPKQYKKFLTKAGFSEIQIFEEGKEGWIMVIGVKKQ